MGRHSSIFALVALSVLVSRTARGEVHVRGDAGFALYSDDQQTTIWSPNGRVGATVAEGVSIDADYSADVITSASVDVITAATSRMEELRQQVGASARWEPPGDWALDGGYLYSFERDSASHVAQLGLRRSLFHKIVDLQFRYAVSGNASGLPDEPRADWRPFWVHSVEAAATVVLGPRTETDFAYAPFVARGYLASPYRRIPIFVGEDLRGAIWLDERVPDSRIRHAIVGRLRHALGSRWVIAGDYRFYTDDWGLRGHAIEASAAAELPRDFTLRIRERFTFQGAADFYRERYTEEVGYRTRDRRLGPMLANLGGAALTWETRRLALSSLAARVGADFLAFRHDEFLAPVASDPSRMEPLAWIVGYVIQVGLELKR